jgi:hypothetical protein
VKSLQLQGIDNGALYELAVTNYDLCFTRDAEFSRRVQSRPVARLKLVHVISPKPTKTNLFSNSLSHFMQQIGQAISAATTGPVSSRLSKYSISGPCAKEQPDSCRFFVTVGEFLETSSKKQSAIHRRGFSPNQYQVGSGILPYRRSKSSMRLFTGTWRSGNFAPAAINV